MKKIFFVLISVLVFASCGNKTAEANTPAVDEKIDNLEHAKGLATELISLMQQNDAGTLSFEDFELKVQAPKKSLDSIVNLLDKEEALELDKYSMDLMKELGVDDGMGADE